MVGDVAGVGEFVEGNDNVVPAVAKVGRSLIGVEDDIGHAVALGHTDEFDLKTAIGCFAHFDAEGFIARSKTSTQRSEGGKRHVDVSSVPFTREHRSDAVVR